MIKVITVEDSTKVMVAKFGANKLFGVDYDERQKMINEQLTELFDRVGQGKIEQLVQGGKVCEYEEVARRLKENQKKYLDSQQKHRSFRHQNAEFIVQLQSQNDQYKLTQLWLVNSSDEYPKTLFINFSSVEERERFRKLAKSLRIDDEELGLRLVRNFMNLHPGYLALDKDPS